MIRVLVTDDSPTVCQILRQCLETDEDIQVVGTAENGKDALKKTQELRPDLITMDIDMPVLNGFEATEQIMAYAPTPILVVTGSDLPLAHLSFKALEVGALDVLPKPHAAEMKTGTTFMRTLIQQVKMLSKVPVIAHMAGREPHPHLPPISVRIESPTKIIAIASSTGGPKVLTELLGALPEGFPAAILLVQHIADGFSDGLIHWLSKHCEMRVALATPGEVIEPGAIYLGPNGRHLMVHRNGLLGLQDSPPVKGFRPSANVLFESVARVYGSKAIGVVLTGMGADGADGIRAIREAGGQTFAQDQETSLVFGMPKAAIETDSVDHVLPAEKIPEELVRLVTDPFSWHDSSEGGSEESD